LQETAGGKVKVQLLCNGEVKEFKQELVTQVLDLRQYCEAARFYSDSDEQIFLLGFDD
jgi:hypothetical protein